MRKTLIIVVAGLALAGCGGGTEKAVTTTSSGADCVAEYNYQRTLLRNRITEFQRRLDSAMSSGVDPTNVRAMLIAEYETVKAESTTGLDQIALQCGATGACAREIADWVAYEKQWLRGVSLLLAGAASSPVEGTEPSVTCT